jgi:TolB protein
MNNKFAYTLFSLALSSMGFAQERPKASSTLEIYTLETGSRKIVYSAEKIFEAPNWVRDGKSLVFNGEGKLFKIPLEGGVPELINSDFADHCNNDHGISPDNKELVISHHEKETGKSMIYVFPLAGGIPRLVTTNGPSYWHGWSPDGKTLAYCAERKGEFDIYTIPLNGGAETRLTQAPGLDDGPDYSPDGKFIYFNSVRSGKMKIWRMLANGSQQEQITKDEYNDWFAHPSPDGKWIVFLSYDKTVEGHPPNKEVMIRMMSLVDRKIKVACKLFGGQGTINVPSWSPDSKQFAFVSYTLL